MWIRVLGSAAGGGFPQWNCGCTNCAGVRAGTLRATPRTQECIALSADGKSWFLLNASPDIRVQLESFPPLQPQRTRHTPIEGILLTSGDLDHCLGLLSLRESQPLVVYATQTVRAGFVEENAFARTLQRFDGHTTWHRLEPGRVQALHSSQRGNSGLTVLPLLVEGKPPLHFLGFPTPGEEHTIGFIVSESSSGKSLAYFSSVAKITERLCALLDEVDLLFFDGTFWSEDELIQAGVDRKRSWELAHLPISGVNGSLRALERVRCPARVYIHVNNTNPILRDDSPERQIVTQAAWQVAVDGMEFRI
jgi:pyrroloquinoline quinone biosynthesis protein B